MALSNVQAVLLSVISYALWRIIRPFVAKTPLSNIPGPAPASWWKGSFHQVFDRNGWDFHRMLYEKYGSVAKLRMVLGDEQLYIFDPLAIHHVIVKEQYTYEETDAFIHTNKLIFGNGLLSTLGDHHRKQRKMLNPVFSLKHMRGLIPVFYPIAYKLREILSNQVRSANGKDINLNKWMSRAALEYIGQGGLGYSFNALDEKAGNTYSEAIKMLGTTNFKLFLPRQFLPWISNIGTPDLRRKLGQILPWESLHFITKMVDIMDTKAREIYNSKREALEEGDEELLNKVGMGKDIMSILLRANAMADEADQLPEEELLGQMNTFIFAGHDTTTSALSRILHQLALNPDVQSKLRAEVTAARKELGDLDYDTLMGLPYLDAVCRETLRYFPPVSVLNRTTRKDVVLPLLWPIKSADGKCEITEIPLKKNTNVIVSIIGANRSKTIWGEDADRWKPERWLKPLPETVSKAHLPGVYSQMMTFNGGGRACIGFKFSEMEMKLVLSILLETFVFAPGSQKIFWAMSSLSQPVLADSDSTYPVLPLKVGFVSETGYNSSLAQ